MHLNPLHLHFGSGIAAASTTSTTTSKTMEWTNDDALELIEQYRHHTELWNRGDPKYKDKLCRFRAWSEIADRFGCSKAEVERKMNVLLTQYRREKHKMLVKMYQGINPNPSKWYAFKRFDFMESGGGSSGGGAPTGGGLLIGGSSSAPGSSSNGSGVNGHSVNSHSASAAAATVAALSGLSASSFDAPGGISLSPSTSSSHHRRIKTKEMKYFGAMGLNLPMLLANNQPLDSSVWSSVGQYSPPISERNHQLRAVPPLSMSFQSASQSELSVPTDGARSLFGGSSNSDIAVSPQKPMETCGGDMDDKDEAAKKELRPSPMATPAATQHAAERGGGSETGDVRGEGGGGSGGADVTSSPIPSANTHDAHQLQLRRQQLQHHQQQQQQQDELDIKQELVDYFHVPHPPAPPDSHRSFNSAEEMRLLGSASSLNGPGCDSGDDYAQDLRVSGSAAASAPRRGLDFSHLMMAAATGGHSRRRSDESLEEKYTPLNMRKVSTASSTMTAPMGAGSSAATAGHVLMHSLRCSNESLSEDGTTTASGGGQRGGGGKSVTSADAASASVAATLYAESLKRDDCDFVGSNVSLKLRSMDRSQRIIAEKLISEVLFYGQFNELDRSARIQPK